ncbi:hypothetical protein Trisim1_005545 [Trichoderma cf. simile WF8]
MCRAAEAQPFVGYRTGHCRADREELWLLQHRCGLHRSTRVPGVAIASSWAVRLEPFLGTRRKSADLRDIKLRVIAASRSGQQHAE